MNQLQSKPTCELYETGGFSQDVPHVGDWTLTSLSSMHIDINTVSSPIGVLFYQARYRNSVGPGNWISAPIQPIATPTHISSLTVTNFDAAIRWVAGSGYPMSNWSANKSIAT